MEIEALQGETLVSNPIYAKKDRNGPPRANQVASKDEPRRSHAVCTLRVHPPTSPWHVNNKRWSCNLVRPKQSEGKSYRMCLADELNRKTRINSRASCT